MREALVAVYCLTYNHGKYIRKTLEGFVSQETDFDFRVIVHDDASTDNTPEIMREFEEKYPDKFVMLYEDENQYSRGVRISDIIFPMIHEKYIAFCEGDDYWCDPHKLQIQVDYMESHPACTLCVHDTMVIDVEGNPIRRINERPIDIDYDANEVIAVGGGGRFHTSSFLANAELFKSKPEEFLINGIGDYPTSIYLSIHGYVHYVGRVMSCYRIGVPGSWRAREMGTVEKRLCVEDAIFHAIIKMDEFTEHKYSKGFKIRKGFSLASFYLNGYKDYKISKLIFKPQDMILIFYAVIFRIKWRTLDRIWNAILRFFKR